MVTVDNYQAIESLKKELDFFKRSSHLEVGRNQVLKMAATGASLAETLNALCEKAHAYSPDMFCSVLRLDNNHGTLHPIADYGLPEFYSNALDGVQIGRGVGSCGTAAFQKERVIVEDINTHPYWAQYKELALSAGLQACWSEPIMGADGLCYGTFAMYYQSPKAPTDEDIHFIEVSANLAAVVFDNHHTREQLVLANQELTKTLDERSEDLIDANVKLEQALNEQGSAYLGSLAEQKVETTKSLVVGVAHEINTPIGIALTSATSAIHILTNLDNIIKSDTGISRANLVKSIEDSLTMLDMNESNLIKATELMDQFKAVNVDTFEGEASHFNLELFFDDVKRTASSLLDSHRLEVDAPNLNIVLNKNALHHTIFQLIENSILHGFAGQTDGLISIHVSQLDGELHINFQDNGRGISSDLEQKIFEPFYSDNRQHEGVGLGLNVVTNIVNNVFGGKVRLARAPIGARFELVIPVELT